VIEATAATNNAKLLSWVEEVAALTRPDSVQWFDGSAEAFEQLCKTLLDAGTFSTLDPVATAPLLPRLFGPG